MGLPRGLGRDVARDSVSGVVTSVVTGVVTSVVTGVVTGVVTFFNPCVCVGSKRGAAGVPGAAWLIAIHEIRGRGWGENSA